ncbi:HXXEE domain-containing protein [Paucisalibacillus sp. EB02]|uniref:HXXEE domain-containing protein n=1 Tax=Paucisalibacillus sp. EB02 TaxID=1347087 RepID=UPI0005AB3223|nr:HXXEE domain-containing protein [Paucisalibacillus sp. EB02]
MDITILMVSFLIIFMLHNLEEIFTIEKWHKETYPRISNRIPSFIQKEIKQFNDITSVQFSLVVFVLSIVVSALILIALITQHYFLFLGVAIPFALNIFTHPLQSLYLRCYTPGVWTTLLLIIPYNILLFYHFYKAGLLNLEMIISSLVVMVFLVPVFLLSHKIGGKWG